MNFPFTPAEKQELGDFLGLPADFGPASVPTRLTVPIDDLRRILTLPEPDYRELLSEERWLAGGGVLRWLGQDRFVPASRGDYDLFLPSVEAVNRSVREFMSQGFQFRCFRSWVPFCPRCGGDAERRGWHPAHDDLLPLPKIHCPNCGDLGSSATRHEVELPVELGQEEVVTRRVTVVELVSPTGDPFHLSTRLIQPSPEDVVANSDYSITQFALDPRQVHGAPYAWTDLLLGRIRLTHPYDHSYRRLRKYWALGFQPYTGTVIRVLQRNLTAGVMGLFRARSRASF